MVVALAGRRIDPAEALNKRFPASAEDTVRSKIREVFSQLQPQFLVCSGACGADLLGIGVAREMTMPVHVLIPFDRKSFFESSVADCGSNWEKMFQDMLQYIGEHRDTNKIISLGYQAGDDDAYLKTNEAIIHEATSLAGMNKLSKSAVVVWDGEKKNESDTTYHFMEHARKNKFPVTEILTI